MRLIPCRTQDPAAGLHLMLQAGAYVMLLIYTILANLSTVPISEA